MAETLYLPSSTQRHKVTPNTVELVGDD